MKTITKQYNIYTFDELTQEAKDKARRDFNEDNDYPFLTEYLREELSFHLKTNKIDGEDYQILYSLSYSQGGGVMFEGSFTWNGYNVKIKHSGHYYHSDSKTIEITDEEDNDLESDEPEKNFDSIYKNICKELEKAGYKYIEYEDSEEHFKEICEANGYTFLEDGKLFLQ